MPTTSTKKLIWSVALAGGLLAAVAFWIGPALIGQAYREESLSILNRALSGRDTHELGFYLALWRRFVLLAFVGLVVLFGLGVFAWRHRSVVRATIARLASGPRVAAGQLIAMSAVFGAAAGSLEAGHLWIRHLIEQDPRRAFIWELWWMAPNSGALAFAGVAALAVTALSVVSRLRGRAVPIPMRWAVGALAFLAVYSMLQSPRFRVAQWSVLVLCAGVATALSRGAAGHPEGFSRLLRRATPVVAGALLIATVVGLATVPGQLEKRRLASLPDPADGLSNVLLIILDTVRAESLSLYGYGRSTTPNLERWARRGVVFENAISPSSWTLPSHASLFTGRYHHEMSADRTVPLDGVHPTLAEVLGQSGYGTAAFAANFTYVAEGSGLERGFARFEDYPVTWGRFLISSWLSRKIASRLLDMNDRPWRTGPKFANHNTDDFLEWLEARDGDRPFFAFLNYLDAHAPYESPARFRQSFPSDQPVVLRTVQGITEADLEGTVAAYDAAIAYLDEELDRLLTTMDRRGDLDDTWVIVSSDHGELFGEHALQGHGNALYLPVVRVPMVIIPPGGLESGARVTEWVSLTDVPATLLDVTLGQGDRLPGRSLARFWDGSEAEGDVSPVVTEVNKNEADPSPWEPTADGSLKSLLAGRHQYIRSTTGGEEIYDVVSDPDQVTDLSGSAEGRLPMEALSRALDSILSGTPNR